MARTERAKPGNQKMPKNASTAAARRSQLSRSMSKLLRHQAENEKVPISSAGWVKLEDLLAWKGLDRIGKGITMTEIFEVVEDDGKHGKGRFAVQFTTDDASQSDHETPEANKDDEPQKPEEGSIDIDGAATGDMTKATSHLTISDSQFQQLRIDPSSKNTPETQLALQHHYTNPHTSLTHYRIRATQGHSIKSIDSTSTHTPLDLSSPDFPSTVVHGTFYASWASILHSGGLKPMRRNNVHFATGPPLSEVLSMTGNKAMSHKSQVDEVLSRNKVISGMRWDAQLLIYIDIKRCMEDIQSRRLDMDWWVSGNGVVLTEGMVLPDKEDEVVDEGVVVASVSAKAQKAKENLRHVHEKQKERVVPMEYWDKVVDIKNGLGVVWEHGVGVVKELPERLRRMPLPAGKGKSSRGGKPRLNVERGDQSLKHGVEDDGNDENEE